MKKVIAVLSFLWIAVSATPNNVIISNISLVGGPGNFRVRFDLSWENGWRVSTGQNNYDGVWVFFKYRVSGDGWEHLTMTGTGNTIPANYTAYYNTGATKTGAIIHRTNDFTGTSILTGVELGVSDVNGFGIDIRAFAIEMVYIPPCSNCIIGDGDGATESNNALHVADNTSGAFGNVFHTDVNAFDDAFIENGGIGITINAVGLPGNTAYATGQAAWCMKYELSLGGYRDFLNTLTLAQQTTRTAFSPNSAIGTGALVANGGNNRNFIEIATPATGSNPAVYGLDASGNNIFNEATDGEWVVCGDLSWPDIAAYLDWAGLSPMTEILFERICRGASTAGPNPSVLGEFAWGDATLFTTPYTFSNLFTANETVTNASATLGNALMNLTNLSFSGSLRNGVFATATSNRVTSGAAFYGVMEMTGNLSEPCITIGNQAGRSFTSINGNGMLSINGNANVPNWPCGVSTTTGPSCSEVTNSAGTIERGGDKAGSIATSKLSMRSIIQVHITRNYTQGCRGVLYVN